MHRFVKIALVSAFVLGTHCRGVDAGDWPQWRGPARDGRAADAPESWPEKLTEAWRIDVGAGHSSPVVVDGKVYQFSREDNDHEVVRCFNLENGRAVWAKSYPAPYEMNPAARNHGKGPKSTPTAAGGRVFTFGISGILTCFDVTDGAVMWKKRFDDEFAKTSPLYGTAASPLVHGGLVVVPVGGHDKGALRAFDVKTGERKWSWDGDGPGYASPIVAKFDDVEQIVTQSQSAVIAVHPVSGKLLWKFPFKTSFDQNSVTPVVVDDLLIIAGYQQPTAAYKVTRDSSGDWSQEKVWENNDVPQYMSTTVATGGNLYGVTHKNKGQLFCLDSKTGGVNWTGDPRGGDNALLLAAGDDVLVQWTNGRSQVIRARADSLKVEAVYETSTKPVWAHPALAGGRLLIKDQDSLICYELE